MGDVEWAGAEGGAIREGLWAGPVPSEGGLGQGGEDADEECGDRSAGEGGGASRGTEIDPQETRAADDGPADDESIDEHAYDEDYESPALAGRRKGAPKRKLRPVEIRLGPAPGGLTGEQRMLALDMWVRSGLPARQVADMLGLSPHTLYAWKKRFEELGPAGLDEKPRGSVTGSRLPEATRRAILMMKKQHPDWGCDRIHDMLVRSAGFATSSGAILRVLREEGYKTQPIPTHPHPPAVHRFERARANQMWQTDLFTFLLKREQQRPRVYLVAFMDDHSRYIVGYGLHATSGGGMVREVFEAAIANYGPPEEVLTDNGSQYHTWRGKSAFKELCERRGIKQIVARPRHPQTLGKIERFWGTLWRDFVQAAIFRDLVDGRRRIGLYIDYYNFHRPHQGLDGLVPADRFFEAAPDVRETLRARVAANALELARHGEPRSSFYLTGRVGEEGISLHGEGGTLVMTKTDGTREEVDLLATGRRVVPTGAAAAGGAQATAPLIAPDVQGPSASETEPTGTTPTCSDPSPSRGEPAGDTPSSPDPVPSGDESAADGTSGDTKPAPGGAR